MHAAQKRQENILDLDDIFKKTRSIAKRFPKVDLFDSDDLTQAAMMKLLGTGKSINCEAYLQKVVRSAYVDMQRKASKDKEHLYRGNFDDPECTSAHQYICEHFDQVAYLGRDRNRTCIDTGDDIRLDALAALETIAESEGKDTVELLLKLACGYSYEQIAKEYGVKIGTIRSRIHYARKKVQGLLEELDL